jgi:hypothetical protein
LNRLDVLKEIKQSLILDVEFSISDGAKKAFSNVTAAFDRVGRSVRIWDITSAQAVDRYRTRSIASQNLDTQPVSFDRTYDSLMATEFKPPRFINANGADLMLYPAFVMVQIGERVALLDIRQVEITVEPTRFVVYDGNVPSDSMVVDSTWQYVNKDGAPDRRFSNNPTIPIAKYCSIFFRGEGLNEAWMISNAEAGIEFGEKRCQIRARGNHPRPKTGAGPSVGLPSHKIVSVSEDAFADARMILTAYRFAKRKVDRLYRIFPTR